MIVVVVGAGAAGLTAAIWAAQAGGDVIALDSSQRLGAKIRVSGGGRCNVLPSHASVDDFHTRGSANVVRRLLLTWQLDDVHRWFSDDLGVALKTEETGKVFPVSDDAGEVVDALLSAAEVAGVQIRTGARVGGVRAEADGWHIDLDGPGLVADRVILCTGGLSLPKTGSDGSGYRFAREAGHQIEATYPALVPLHLDDPDLRALSGLSVPARITATREGRTMWESGGDLLFTHKGLSGPVALDASHLATAPWASGTRLVLGVGDLASDEWRAVLTAGGRRQVSTELATHLPERLAATVSRMAGLPDGRTLAELRRDERQRLISALTAHHLVVTGDGGYRLAEVTGGGVELGSVDPRTLESRVAPGLHLAGEVLDVTGRLGGYNFLWAWVTGRLAGEAAARGSDR